MKKVLIIYNPFSGNRTILNNLDKIISRFQEKGVITLFHRLYTTENQDLIKEIKETQVDFIVVAGGDGTLYNVNNKLQKNNIEVPVGIIPTGTCNDFASSINIPNDIDECLDIILDGEKSCFDVGIVNGETYFLSTLAGGNFVGVSFETHNELKKNFGPFAYYLKALSEVNNIKPVKLKLQTENETIKEEIIMFLILNGKQGAGFSNLISDADLSDGLMDIILFKKCSSLDLAALFFRVLSGEEVNSKNVHLTKAKTCKIYSKEEVLVSIDGEKGPELPLKIEFINKRIEVFVKR